MQNKILVFTVFGLLLLPLAACGSSKGDRALSGGAIGAGAGAVGAAATDSNVGGGAVLGGIVGAGVGAVTDEDDIDLDN